MSGYLNQFAAMVAGLVQTAIQVAGDMATSIVYSSLAGDTYNPATGTVTSGATTYSFNGVISKFSNSEIDNKTVIIKDAKLICSALDLPIEPRENDTLTGNGKNWKVQRVLGVPANSMWKIQIREL